MIPANAVRVFLSYARADRELMLRVATLLDQHAVDASPLQIWHDQHLFAGIPWRPKIEAMLNSSNVVLLLLSEHFLSSKECMAEAAVALHRQGRGECEVLPVLIQNCSWRSSPFSALQVTPTSGQPLSNSDDAAVTKAIATIIDACNQQWLKRTKNAELEHRDWLSEKERLRGLTEASVRLQNATVELANVQSRFSLLGLVGLGIGSGWLTLLTRRYLEYLSHFPVFLAIVLLTSILVCAFCIARLWRSVREQRVSTTFILVHLFILSVTLISQVSVLLALLRMPSNGVLLVPLQGTLTIACIGGCAGLVGALATRATGSVTPARTNVVEDERAWRRAASLTLGHPGCKVDDKGRRGHGPKAHFTRVRAVVAGDFEFITWADGWLTVVEKRRGSLSWVEVSPEERPMARQKLAPLGTIAPGPGRSSNGIRDPSIGPLIGRDVIGRFAIGYWNDDWVSLIEHSAGGIEPYSVRAYVSLPGPAAVSLGQFLESAA